MLIYFSNENIKFSITKLEQFYVLLILKSIYARVIAVEQADPLMNT